MINSDFIKNNFKKYLLVAYSSFHLVLASYADNLGERFAHIAQSVIAATSPFVALSLDSAYFLTGCGGGGGGGEEAESGGGAPVEQNTLPNFSVKELSDFFEGTTLDVRLLTDYETQSGEYFKLNCSSNDNSSSFSKVFSDKKCALELEPGKWNYFAEFIKNNHSEAESDIDSLNIYILEENIQDYIEKSLDSFVDSGYYVYGSDKIESYEMGVMHELPDFDNGTVVSTSAYATINLDSGRSFVFLENGTSDYVKDLFKEVGYNIKEMDNLVLPEDITDVIKSEYQHNWTGNY